MFQRQLCHHICAIMWQRNKKLGNEKLSKKTHFSDKNASTKAKKPLIKKTIIKTGSSLLRKSMRPVVTEAKQQKLTEIR